MAKLCIYMLLFWEDIDTLDFRILTRDFGSEDRRFLIGTLKFTRMIER